MSSVSPVLVWLTPLGLYLSGTCFLSVQHVQRASFMQRGLDDVTFITVFCGGESE